LRKPLYDGEYLQAVGVVAFQRGCLVGRRRRKTAFMGLGREAGLRRPPVDGGQRRTPHEGGVARPK